jgi:hypothetical protein
MALARDPHGHAQPEGLRAGDEPRRRPRHQRERYGHRDRPAGDVQVGGQEQDEPAPGGVGAGDEGPGRAYPGAQRGGDAQETPG